MYALLKKAGLGSTASMVTAGALDTYSQTGSYKEVAKNAIINTIITSAIFAGISGVKGIFAKVETAFGQIIDTAKAKLQEDNDTDINENGQIANKEAQLLIILIIQIIR